MEFQCEKKMLGFLASRHPDAVAHIRGNKSYPNLKGTVCFYQQSWGVYVIHSISGLPKGEGECGDKVLAFHIHNGSGCTGTAENPFANAGSHYNPADCQHPYHAGDLPPVFANDGYAWGAVMTQRLAVSDIIGLPVIIHSAPDDLTTQPSGNPGEMIACGMIEK